MEPRIPTAFVSAGLAVFGLENLWRLRVFRGVQ